ncbi:hypothetical protein CEXT_251391 [Caerostris extrusa]|uniref:Uncharacterized protein n=1 Tax=Caerostris extrusa TaxID=172846 RepID=A0AAV4NG97_CAEEX|nr:hypothetical protein CEXT_251391 [Caerostris extrusa]
MPQPEPEHQRMFLFVLTHLTSEKKSKSLMLCSWSGLSFDLRENPLKRDLIKTKNIFGDSPKPLDQSALLVEKILRDQMNMLLIKASEISPRISRRSLKASEISPRISRHSFKAPEISPRISRRSLTHEHILFLLKENKVKMRRLLHYLNLKDASESISRKKFTSIKDVMMGEKLGNRMQLCLKYLQKLILRNTDLWTLKLVKILLLWQEIRGDIL